MDRIRNDIFIEEIGKKEEKERMRWKEIEQEQCIKIEEIGSFQSADPYKTVKITEEERK